MSNITPFPYQRQFHSDAKIFEEFEKLKKYDYKKKFNV